MPTCNTCTEQTHATVLKTQCHFKVKREDYKSLRPNFCKKDKWGVLPGFNFTRIRSVEVLRSCTLTLQRAREAPVTLLLRGKDFKINM